jgi:hypothetical protein
VTAIVLVPVAAPLETTMFRSLVPLPPVIGLGANAPETPDGKPLADNATSEFHPFADVDVITFVPDPPRGMVRELADGLRE